MVRATAARVLVRLGGNYPPGWDASSVGDLCTQADYLMDAYTYPTTLSTTDDKVIEIAVEIVLRMMLQADMMQRSVGTLSKEGMMFITRSPLTDDIKHMLDAMLLDDDYAGMTTVDMMEDD